MLDRITEYHRALSRPEDWAIATVVSVAGSSPAPVGTSMAVSRNLEIIGSLSGGCVESTTASLAQQTLEDESAALETFGPDGGRLGEVPLTCGGQIRVLIQPLGTLTGPARDQALVLTRTDPHDAAEFRREVTVGNERLAVHEYRETAPRLLLFGVQDYSMHLAQMAVAAGWRTILVDHRPAFASADRVPAGAELIVDDPASAAARLLAKPDAGWTAACVMTHHPDLDVPVLDTALLTSGRVDFLGALGSRNSQTRRRAALTGLGHPAERIARIHGPLGLDIGGASPAESAVSVLAQLIAARSSGMNGPSGGRPQTGTPLSLSTGPINYARARVSSILQPAGSVVS